MKVKKTVIFSRHGLRYPLIFKKNFIEVFGKDITNWNFSDEKMGLLTHKGELIEHKFGINLKNSLDNFNLEYIFCNSMERTYLTAKAISLGICPYKNNKIEYKYDDFSQMDYDFCLKIKNFSSKIIDDMKIEEIDKKLLPIYTRMEELLKVEKGTISNKKTNIYLGEDNFIHVRGALKIATDVCDLFILKYYEGFPENEIFESNNFLEDLKFLAIAKDVFLDCIFANKDFYENSYSNVFDNILMKELKSDRKDALIVGHDSNLSLILSKLGINYTTNIESIEKYPIGAKLIFKIYEDNSYDLYYTYFKPEAMRNLNNNEIILEYLKRGQL